MRDEGIPLHDCFHFRVPAYRLSARVNIFKTKEDLHHAVTPILGARKAGNNLALSCNKQYNKDKKKNFRAEFFFFKDFYGSGIVTHELLHTALFLCKPRRVYELLTTRWDKNSKNKREILVSRLEESLCNVIEEISRKFWDAFYKKGKRGTRAAKKYRKEGVQCFA